ncbi:unnamed protein product [Phyllotreta striolata]|uniref:Cadherin domain-containing protein n=1 Tax=Phyllotreta striolata TaxID=444603 RepID=A0A9N9TBE4_PHYSR|nr:unnamed protein product [Phyllotreta striolata]
MNNPQSSAITVKIEVTDVNDNPPKWPRDPITISVSENAEIGASIYNLTATDADSGSNSDLRYSLLEQHPQSDAFSVDSLTGALNLASKLDFEATKEYLLVVLATDQCQNASERLSASATLRLLVDDYNDNAPRFVAPAGPVYTSDSTALGSTVAHLIAVDEDRGDNGRVTYAMSGGNDEGLFSLGYDTGSLTLTKPLEDNGKSFVLNVTASDHGNPSKTTAMELKLIVQSFVDAAPKFLEVQYVVEVAEDVAVDTVITKLSARSGLTEANNLTFILPSDETFRINSPTGEVLAKKRLDREAIDTYVLTVFVSDSSYKTTLFDTTTLIIKVTDINDNVPKFRTGSCYRLSVPENSETSVVHTMVAEDGDEGSNGEVYYTITSGNAGNKFSIDTKTGELTARPLDRESQSKYFLTIVAKDRGTPAMQSVCNLTVTVEDQNDNDPKFDLSEYSTAILENVPVDTSVLKVHASDADLGINARIIYSLSNESHWLFRVDNKTGVITTTGSFDREKENVYTFLIVATDGGKYNARSQSVPVTVKILDFNDNKPTFTRYPFKEKVTPYIQPGQQIIKITATDDDEATNAEIVYTISTDDSNGKFRINPNTGIITTTQSLAAHKGKIIYLNVLATDKGNPPMSSSGLVEIQVGDLPETSPSLLFQNATYAVTLAENTERLKEVVRVGAVRSDGRRQRVAYSIGAGDDAGVFIIDSTTGIIQVRDPDGLDFELHRNLALVVEARTEGQPDLRGYCDVIVQLTDENDNSPKFTQRQYAASVWEGNKKGEFVLQVVAGDADEGANSRILYHIVDGNHDNAFKIEPAFSGILKTNIVLDREIRDAYRLTVIATDEGVPQMTGTARIRINVVDVNDNQPTFPPHSVITVKEDTPVGTVLTIATANDVDTYPPLTYGFAKDNYKKDLQYFSIDRYSGKVILKKSLDYETWQECKIGIVASDGVHSAQTSLTIKVIDVNDNAPSFSQSSYFATLPEGNSPTLIDIAYLNASDADSEENAKLQYSLVSSLAGFSIDADEGILKANLSATSRYTDEILLTIKATDMGNPPQHSIVPIRIRTNGDASSTGSKTLGKTEYKISVQENTTRGSTIMHLTKPPSISSTYYRIVDGNDDGNFEAINPSGALVLVKPLDRETRDTYNLKITADASSMSLVTVEITVEDSNDNPPMFQSTDHATTISENLPIGASVEALLAIDADLPQSPNSRILYSITSGNDEGCFALDSHTGLLTVNKSLDFDRGAVDYNLVVKACDEGSPSLCALQTIAVSLQDENDNEPMFPVSEYFEFVGENEAVGTVVFTARASDADRGRFGRLTYSILPSYAQLDNSWKLFNVDSTTGLVTTSTAFDYEQRSRYNFVVKAEDAGGKFTSVKVRVDIEGKDEFHPQFTERTYKLTLATSSALPVGYIVGHVTATDRDKGPDGRVVYQLMTQHSYFKVNRTTGDILVKKKFDYVEIPNNGREISLVITASSGRQGSLTNMTVVEIILDPLADPGTNLAINRGDAIPATTSGIADWALGLLIALLLLIIAFGAAFVFLHMRNKRNKQSTKPNLGAADAVSTANNFVDADPRRRRRRRRRRGPIRAAQVRRDTAVRRAAPGQLEFRRRHHLRTVRLRAIRLERSRIRRGRRRRRGDPHDQRRTDAASNQRR